MKRWSALAGCFIGLAVCVGPIFWLALGLYLKPITAEFHWTRTEFAFVFSLASFANGLMHPIAGYFVDRFGAPRVILVGVIGLFASYAGLSVVQSFTQFASLACLVAVAGAIASYPAYLSVPLRWFDRNLGLAMALASSGIGVGGAIFPYIISASIGLSGWRQTFVNVGLIALVIGLVNLAVLIRVNKGPIPDTERRAVEASAESVDIPFLLAMRTSDFWLFSIAFALIFLVTIGINFHLASLINDRGGSPAEGAAAVAAVGMASLAGRLVTGPLLDRFTLRVVALVFFVGQAIGCILLLEGLSPIAAGALLGLAQGAELDMLPFVITRRFGKIAYAQIFGTCYAILCIGQIISPMVLATIFDRTGSYALGLTFYPILSLVALALVWIARVTQSGAPAHSALEGGHQTRQWTGVA